MLNIVLGLDGVIVIIELDEYIDLSVLLDGIYVQVVVYFDYFSYVLVMWKVLLRMISWMYYFYLDY